LEKAAGVPPRQRLNFFGLREIYSIWFVLSIIFYCLNVLFVFLNGECEVGNGCVMEHILDGLSETF
jgi:hypothetical protein